MHKDHLFCKFVKLNAQTWQAFTESNSMKTTKHLAKEKANYQVQTMEK